MGYLNDQPTEIKTDIRMTGRPREWDMGIDSWLTDSEKKEIFLIVLAIQIILDVIKQIKELIDNY